MGISRRDFLESSALTAAGLVFGNRLVPTNAVGEQTAEAAAEQQQYGWPRKPQSRVVLSFDQSWRFIRAEGGAASALSSASGSGDISAWNDASWERVNLPHTVRLESLSASGGRNYQGICWYQKHFAAPAEWRGRTVYLVFQGAMQVADVWLNGKHLTTHYGGYLPFTVNISQHAQFDESNVLTVRLDNSDNPDVPPGKPQYQLDFVYFGGLYRSVQIEVLGDLHISDPVLADKPAGGGVFVTPPSVTSDMAVVQIQTDVVNVSGRARRAKVRQELTGPDGRVLAAPDTATEIESGSSKTVTQA
jgi:beta-galactosidase